MPIFVDGSDSPCKAISSGGTVVKPTDIVVAQVYEGQATSSAAARKWEAGHCVPVAVGASGEKEMRWVGHHDARLAPEVNDAHLLRIPFKTHSIHWYSYDNKIRFRITGTERESREDDTCKDYLAKEGRLRESPLSPFRLPLRKDPSTEANSGTVEDKSAICQIYKISLEVEIDGKPVKVDPDMVCGPP